MFKDLKTLILDNSGDENVSKMIWVCIVFTVGAILLLMVTAAFENEIKSWYHSVVESWFDGSGAHGQYVPAGGVAGQSYVPGGDGGFTGTIVP